MPDPNAPLPSLDTLQRRIDVAKGRSPEEAPADSSTASMGQAMRFIIELLSGVIVGCVAGYYLDRWLNTFPIFLIICFFLGAAAGFRNLLREAMTMNKDMR